MDDVEHDHPWQVYERVVAAMISDEAGTGIDLTSTMDARVVGAISGVERQIDCLSEARWEPGLARRIIVDAKRYGRKLNVKDVESFEGMMRDCRAQHEILVCPSGWSEGAERRAGDAITIKLITLEDIDETDAAWFEPCSGRCLDRSDPRKRGVVLWSGQLPLAIDGLWAIVFTGVCDTCHSFQAWCWDCGETISVGDGEEEQCSCDRWWAAIEDDEVNPSGEVVGRAVYLALGNQNGKMWIDRRSLH